MKQHVLGRVVLSVLAGSGLIWAVSGPTSAQPPTLSNNCFVYNPNAHPQGQSYEEWSASITRWIMELPVEGHPGSATSTFDVSYGQSGNVWFLLGLHESSPETSSERSCTIPKGKSLFVILIGGEQSSLEGFPTEQEQRDAAVWQADHILPESLFCELDGEMLTNPGDYRFESPQFEFFAPTPWVFGEIGGAGTSVSDGYAVFLKKLKKGQHALHFGGQFHFSVAEGDPFDFDGWVNTTYNITQL